MTPYCAAQCTLVAGTSLFSSLLKPLRQDTVSTMDLDERRLQLRDAIAEQWEYELRESPEFATMIGDYRYNDRWSDLLAGSHRGAASATSWLDWRASRPSTPPAFRSRNVSTTA